MNLLIRISWDDSRLCQNKTLNNILEGGYWHFERLWRPSLHVPNSKLPNVLQDTQENPLLVRINSMGRVLVSKRLRLEGKCQINFRLYPLDIKKIVIDIESSRWPRVCLCVTLLSNCILSKCQDELSTSNLQLHWNEHDPIEQSAHFDLESYELLKYNTLESISNYTHTGSFSSIKAVLYFQCSFGQFLLDIYIPIVLFVVVSWTSFWIEITAAPARVTLGLTVLLTMVTTAKSARDKLPSLPYVHSMEIWILVSIVFVFATVIEFATVNYIYFDEKRSLLKKNKRKKSVARRERAAMERKAGLARSKFYWRKCFFLQQKSQKVSFAERAAEEGADRAKGTGGEEKAMEIDRLARIIFPFTYFVFNIVYWVVIAFFSHQAKDQME